MIIWGSGGKAVDLGQVDERHCELCEKHRPFKLLLQYRFAHLYYLRWVTEKKYHLACDICHRGWVLSVDDVESKLEKNPIPFMTRFGWTFLLGGVALIVLLANL
ncbi:hypothetical protein ABH309_24830 [Chromobacterium piscinae]|uniref:Zinc-ribbon domain-containing protein n=1 Tax=Chromobacterium piscinae TaxID=686831 RepID=A0ABV0HEH8_9NEIS